MRSNSLALVAASALMLAGCGGPTFSLLKPVYPEAGNPLYATKVDNLQPTFRWEAAKEPGVVYDFILYECIGEYIDRMVGRELYYREGLTATEHQIEYTLVPGKEYFWTVRLREGDKVSGWATYNYTPTMADSLIHSDVTGRNLYFLIATPKK